MPDRPAPTLEVVTDVPDRAMVVFAHPDDAEIGSGGVVARWIEAGCEVTYVLCTNGDAGSEINYHAAMHMAAKTGSKVKKNLYFSNRTHPSRINLSCGRNRPLYAILPDPFTQ